MTGNKWRRTVQEVLEDWQQFLLNVEVEGETRYGVYHASFSDFIRHQRCYVRGDRYF